MGDLLEETFIDPPDEFTPIPFWFWNDSLNRDEILRQMADFRSKGVMGVVIHPRIGLPREIGYLSDVFMDMVETAVEEAEATGMVIYLYDEGMYPSGSAHGMVVEGHPELASRGLMKVENLCQGPAVIPINLDPGERLVSVQAARWIAENELDLSASQVLAIEEGKVRFTPPDDGRWSVFLFVETFTRGVIRGIHFGEDDWEENPPAAADLLNLEAVQRFIQLTHEKYYRRLKRHFGRTIQAFFTDEPMIMGRRSREGLRPWTGGFLDYYLKAGGAETDLPALWVEAGTQTISIRRRYEQIVRKRLAETYYQPLSAWCADHGVALTGHPAESDDIGVQRYFHIPGQDQVLRWVAPENEKGLEGRHSTLAKCASDAARHAGRRRNAVECFGACSRPGSGWNLTGADLKWMTDWLFVRGVNLLIPHAFYYSIRGPRRSGERPPDVGPNNIWWPDYATFVRYIKRLGWLMTDGVNVTPIAVLAESDRLPWALVKPLYQHQIEFNYLEEELLISGKCKVEAGEIYVARQRYRWLLIDSPERLSGKLVEVLQDFIRDGGKVLIFDPTRQSVKLPGACLAGTPEHLIEMLLASISPDVVLQPPHPDLRASHVVKDGCHFYLLVNEGEDCICGGLRLGISGRVDAWDAWQGSIEVNCSLLIGENGILTYPLHLERRSSLILRIDPNRPPRMAQQVTPRSPVEIARLVNGWTVVGGPAPANGAVVLDNWTQWPGWENYSGKATYSTLFTLSELKNDSRVTLDLGEVNELAHVFVNGIDAGYRWWPPYRFQIGSLLKEGENKIEVEVTNSLANRMDSARLRSGLIGPVVIAEG